MQNDNENENDRNQRIFEAHVEDLRHNKTAIFHFDSVLDQRWTLLQANQLFRALKTSTSVEELGIEPAFCPIPAFPLLLDCIRSNPKFDQISIYKIDDEFDDNEETREKYTSLISDIFRAVGQNPSIKRLTSNCLGNCPEAVFDLLSKTKTIHCLEILQSNMDDSPIATTKMASHIAAGFSQNTSLDSVKLGMSTDCLAIAMSGIARSAIKSLSVDLIGPTVKFLPAISTLLPIAPSLKTLVVNGDIDEEDNDDDIIDELFSSLHHPGCSIENLELRSVRLGSSDEASTPQANRNLRILDLGSIKLRNNRSVSQLWHLVGLTEMHVTAPCFDNDPPEDPDCWAELVRRNPNLMKLIIVDSSWINCAKGFVNGACGHESLEILKLDMAESDLIFDKHVGAQLCRLFRETKPLKTLHMSGVSIQRQGAELMVEGICDSKTLQHLVFGNSEISLPVCTILMESFVVNQTVETFDFRDCFIDGSADEARAFCQTLSQVFRMNTSLESCRLPPMQINAENGLMNVLVDGLFPNKTLETIDFSSCTLDQAAWTCLEQALVVGNENPGTLSVSSVRLPRLSTEDGIKPFLRNLARMPSIKEVTISNSLDAEGKNLLLQAVQEKKTLRAFERDIDDSDNDPIDTQIDFYLKLNRLGRQIVECPNVPSSCWPILLSRMTNKSNKDPAALFYFAREYFANHQQQQQQPHDAEQAQPCKRARLE